jgi:predicted kinase
MLLIFGGLPGTGKTALARELARQTGAMYLRIDSIEQVIRDCNPERPVNEAGYRVAYAIAEDNLRLGRTVIADSVNPLQLTRDAWRDVARRAAVGAAEIEVICSNQEEHRRRVEQRTADIHGLKLPTWQQVVQREYEPWHEEHILIDTASESIGGSVRLLLRMLRERRFDPASQ